MPASLRPLSIALALVAMSIAGLELRLAYLGYEPSIADGPDRWIIQRMRASMLGDRALIIVGASRIQLGLDMNTLRRETGLEPVQLAVLGSSPVTVLAGLANDPTINGTILVDYYDGFAMADTASRYQDAYERKLTRNPLLILGESVEVNLTQLVRDHLRSYAGGASPLASLKLALAGTPRQLYLTTLPDRSRRADYSRVNMPEFYHRNVMRSLGINLEINDPAIERILQKKIAALVPINNHQFLLESQRVKVMIATIRARGGKVIFVKMPTSGMVEEIESRQFPREAFWEPFLKLVDAPGIWVPSWPDASSFKTPDGSHLDFRYQASFTRSLIRAARESFEETAQQLRKN